MKLYLAVSWGFKGFYSFAHLRTSRLRKICVAHNLKHESEVWTSHWIGWTLSNGHTFFFMFLLLLCKWVGVSVYLVVCHSANQHAIKRALSFLPSFYTFLLHLCVAHVMRAVTDQNRKETLEFLCNAMVFKPTFMCFVMKL